MTHYKYKFESTDELLRAIQAPHANPDNASHSFYRNRRHDRNWMCQDRAVSNIQDVHKHLANPLYPQGVARIEKLASQLCAPTPKSRRRKAVRSDAGDELDMQRVYQGELHSAWSATRREQTTGPSRVLIAVRLGAGGGISAETLALRGATALALATTLKEAGYTVSIVGINVGFICDSAKSTYACEVQVLAADQEPDIHRLASMIASGLLFRGVMLDHIIRVCENKVDSGIGSNKPLEADSFDTSGFDHVALLEDLQDIYQANQWLATQLAVLQPEV